MPLFRLPRPTRCRWSRARLALFAGGDLRMSERRLVERHLIGCPSCRESARSLAESVAALRESAAAAESIGPGSVWPALRLQILASRHEPRPFPILRTAAAAALVEIAGGVVLRAVAARFDRTSADAARAKVVAGRPPLPLGEPAGGPYPAAPRREEPHFGAGSGAGREGDPQRSY